MLDTFLNQTGEISLSLADKIKEHFWTETPPEFPSFDPAYADDEDVVETAAFVGKRWSELNFELFDENSLVLDCLPKETLPYYFGAFLYLSLLEGRYWSNAISRVSDIPGFLRLCGFLSFDQMRTAEEYFFSILDNLEAEQIFEVKKILHVLERVLESRRT